MIALLAVSAVWASAPITREAVVTSVNQHFPLILSAERDRIRAESDLLSSEGGFDPVITGSAQFTPQGEYQQQLYDLKITQPTTLWGAQLSAGYRLGSGNIPTYDGQLLTNSGGEWRLGLEIPLLQGGPVDRRRTQIGLNRWSLTLSETALAQQKIEATRMALSRYIDWLGAGARLKVADHLLTLAQDRDRVTHHRVKKGDAAKIERTDNQRNVAQRRAIQIQSIRALQKTALELSLYYRDASGSPVVPTPDDLPGDGLALPTVPTAASVRPEKKQIPDIVRFDQLSEQVALEKKLAENLLLPKLDGFIYGSQDLGLGSTSRATPELKLGVKLEFPILFRGARGQVAALEASRMRLDAQRELAQNRYDVSLQDLEQSMDMASQRARTSLEEVEFALAVEEAERVKLALGDSNILFVNLRELATAEAQQRVIEAQVDYHRARIELDALLTDRSTALRESVPATAPADNQ